MLNKVRRPRPDGKPHVDTWDSTCVRRKWCHVGQDYLSGKWDSKMNIRPDTVTDREWRSIWRELSQDEVFTLPVAMGEVAANCSDFIVTIAAHRLKSHIIVFEGLTNEIQFVDGNTFVEGNVDNQFPFILGHTRSHYQSMIPDKNVENAYEKILAFCEEKAFQNRIGSALIRSVQVTTSAIDDPKPGPSTQDVDPQPGPSTQNPSSESKYFC